MQVIALIIVLLVVIGILLYSGGSKNKEEPFGLDDKNYALSALDDLNSAMLENRIQEVDKDYLMKHAPWIYLAKLKDDKIAQEDAQKEEMTFFHPVNTQYWPYYYYSNPYQYQNSGAWPPGMSSRLYNWQPGFETSGWSYWLRPGMSYVRWPRSRWVKQNGSYYFINNGSKEDRINDYSGDPS
jgi:hypothetical protein